VKTPAELGPNYWNGKVQRILVGSLLLEVAAALAYVLPGPFAATAVPLAVLGIVRLCIMLALLVIAWYGSRV
jgi:hypothetical protein